MNINNQDDLVLIQSGNERDKNKLFEKYNKLIYGFFFKKTKDTEISQELTQEALMKLNDRLGDYNKDYPFNVWVYKIINNHLRDYYRLNSTKRRKLELSFLDTDSPKTQGMKSTSIDLVLDELHNKSVLENIHKKAKQLLSDVEYNIYDLKFVKDYTYNELEEELHIERKKILYVVSTIRKKIRNHLRAI